MSTLIDLTGQQFGRLTVLSRSPTRIRNLIAWTCACSCGTVRDFVGVDLRIGDSTSCGCRKTEIHTERLTKHGMTGHPAYRSWSNMKQRCTDEKNPAFENYGGRGITVCDRWLASFENFWADMGPTWAEGLSIDRRENDGPYSPQNCRWATDETQANNTRKNRVIDTPDGPMTVAQASRKFGLAYSAVITRLHRGATEAADLVGELKLNPTQKNAIKTECSYGHPLSGENLMLRKNGGRDCRICVARRDVVKYENFRARCIAAGCSFSIKALREAEARLKRP